MPHPSLASVDIPPLTYNMTTALSFFLEFCFSKDLLRHVFKNKRKKKQINVKLEKNK